MKFLRCKGELIASSVIILLYGVFTAAAIRGLFSADVSYKAGRGAIIFTLVLLIAHLAEEIICALWAADTIIIDDKAVSVRRFGETVKSIAWGEVCEAGITRILESRKGFFRNSCIYFSDRPVDGEKVGLVSFRLFAHIARTSIIAFPNFSSGEKAAELISSPANHYLCEVKALYPAYEGSSPIWRVARTRENGTVTYTEKELISGIRFERAAAIIFSLSNALFLCMMLALLAVSIMNGTLFGEIISFRGMIYLWAYVPFADLLYLYSIFRFHGVTK